MPACSHIAPFGSPVEPGGEVDVGELVGAPRRRPGRRRRGPRRRPRRSTRFAHRGHGGQRLVERGGAARLGQHQPALGARERGRDPVGREVRLDRQVHPAGLEDGDDGGHPVQVALGDHRDHALAAQPAGQQGPAQPVGAGVELPVGPLPAAVHGGDRVRVRPAPAPRTARGTGGRAAPARGPASPSSWKRSSPADSRLGPAGSASGSAAISASARAGGSRRSGRRPRASSTSVR